MQTELTRESSEPVELHTHFHFDCDECGVENLLRIAQGEMEIQSHSAEQHLFVTQGSHDLRILVVIAPKRVICKHCGYVSAAIVCGAIDELV